MALILIADGSGSIRQKIRVLVEANDHVVVEADSAVYCLEIAQYHHPQCIIFNSTLSDAEEVQFLSTLKTLDIPAIAITSDTATESPISAHISQSSDPNAELVQTVLQIFTPAQGMAEENGHVPSTTTQSALSANGSAHDTNGSAHDTNGSANKTDDGLLSFDQLQTLIALGMDEAAVTLNDLTDCPITFEPPVVETMTARSLSLLLKGRFNDQPICAAQLPFHGGLSGTAQLFFPSVSGDSLTCALTGEEPDSEDFAELKEEALTEVGNIVLNSVMGTMSNGLAKHLEFSIPKYAEDTIAGLTTSLAEEPTQSILLAQTQFDIPELNIQGDILLFFKMSLFFDVASSS